MKRHIRFGSWNEPGSNAIVEKDIIFENDGHFTTNSLTSVSIPQNEDEFEKIINVYLSMDNVTEIDMNQNNNDKKQ